MFRTFLAAAFVVAQIPMPHLAPRVPMPAQAPPGPGDGITVTGSAYAAAQASQAQITLRISARNNAPTLTEQTLQPIADALVRAGADRSSVQLPPYLVGQARTNNAAITASVQHPTTAMLQQGMLTIANAFAANPDLILNGAEIRLLAGDCSALQRAAEANAIADARANAAFIAKQIEAKVGSCTGRRRTFDRERRPRFVQLQLLRRAVRRIVSAVVSGRHAHREGVQQRDDALCHSTLNKRARYRNRTAKTAMSSSLRPLQNFTTSRSTFCARVSMSKVAHLCSKSVSRSMPKNSTPRRASTTPSVAARSTDPARSRTDRCPKG